MKQVLCYLCCAEFGTTSLKIHQKTCLKKHKWGLDLIENEEGIPKKQAALNRRKCVEPGPGTSLPLPSAKSKAKDFDEYNDDVMQIFTAHSHECLYCRERNHEAIENAKHAAQAANLKQQHDDEEAKRKAEEEEERRRREEEEAKRKHDEEAAAHEEAARQRALEAAKKAAEEDARKKAEEEARKKAEEEARKKAEEEARLAAQEEERKKAEEEARQKALEEERRKQEEEARQKALEEEAKRLAEEKAKKEDEEDEDAKMMRIIKEEEAERRAQAEAAAREKKRIALGQHKYLKKHDGVQASSQAGLCYQDKKADERAKEDMANMSIAHAKQEKLVKEHHQVGGESFHAAHTSKVVMVEVDVDENGKPVE